MEANEKDLSSARIPGKMHWQPVAHDPVARTLTIESLLLIEPNALTQYFQPRIQSLIVELVGKQGLFLPNGRPLSHLAFAERYRSITISLDDGGTVSAAEVVMSRLGPLWTRNETVITRE